MAICDAHSRLFYEVGVFSPYLRRISDFENLFSCLDIFTSGFHLWTMKQVPGMRPYSLLTTLPRLN
ncbi:MAG: hypothetical protein LBM61_00485 [Prevotellaceae bacterium]|nr:hypothetical protein [Prevotellaceae bacterium]